MGRVIPNLLFIVLDIHCCQSSLNNDENRMWWKEHQLTESLYKTEICKTVTCLQSEKSTIKTNCLLNTTLNKSIFRKSYDKVQTSLKTVFQRTHCHTNKEFLPSSKFNQNSSSFIIITIFFKTKLVSNLKGLTTGYRIHRKISITIPKTPFTQSLANDATGASLCQFPITEEVL